MKHNKLFVLCAAAVLALSACTAQPQEPAEPENESPVLTDGTYEGTANGHNGPLTVSMSVAEGKIATVEVTSHVETKGVGDPAIERVPQQIVDHQSVNVDIITGATITSGAIASAAKDCISQAG